MIHTNMDESPKHYDEKKKPDVKRHTILHLYEDWKQAKLIYGDTNRNSVYIEGVGTSEHEQTFA